MDKRFWAILGVIAVIVVGAIWISNDNKAGAPSSNAKPTQHIEGEGKSGVTLVEYGDYECPYCGQYAAIVSQVASEFSQQITFQFRNFPLTSLHPNAFAAARAAEAASLQGKFWQMHDALYEQNVQYYDSGEKATNWVGASDPETYFVQDAQQLGLNTTKFKQDYEGDQVNNLVNADMSAGNALNVSATPTFFLDGKQINPSESAASFEKLINAAITQKTGKSSNITSNSSSNSSASSNSAPKSKQ